MEAANIIWILFIEWLGQTKIKYQQKSANM